MGQDSPPALGLMNPQLQPPPGLPPLTVPPRMPTDHAEAMKLLQAIPEYLKNELQRHDYQQHLDVAQRIKEGPNTAEGLRTRMMLEPDAKDIDSEIDAAEPYLPKSATERLRQSRKRTKVLRSEMDTFDQDLEKELRSSFSKSVVRKESEGRAKDLREELQVIRAKIDRESRMHIGTSMDMSTPEILKLGDRAAEIQAELKTLGGGEIELGDVGRGLKSVVGNNATVADTMFQRAKEMIDARVGPVEQGYQGDRVVNPMTAAGKMQEAMLKGTRPTLPEGVTPTMYRAALAEQAAKTIQRVKGHTVGKDLLSGASSMVPWMLGGIGEVGISAKVADSLIAGSRLAKSAPKIASAAKAAITYVAGPAVIEGTIAAVQPLPASAQNEVDQIEDRELKDATEGAYRVLQVSQAAALSALFSMSDVAHAFAAGGSLGKMAQRYVEKSSLGKTIGSTLGMAAAGPALTDLTHKGIEEVVAATRSGDVSTSDVLADMAQAKNPALFGAARRFLESPSLETAKDYALEAAPMAAGIATVHAMSFVGAKLTSRAQMLDLNRKAETEVQAMVDKGDLPQDVADVVKRKLRQETEQLAPTKAEDRRRATDETLTEALGKEGADARIMAEKAAEDLLPQVEGTSVKEKLRAAIEAHDRDPENPDRQRDLEVAMHLEEAAAAKDKEEAALAMSSARDRAAPDAEPRDPADRALGELIAHDEQVSLRPEELDQVSRRVADEVTRQWEIVHRDEESGDFTLRSLDSNERITVPDNELMHYRIADEVGADAQVPRGTTQEPTGTTPSQFRDELHDTAVQAVRGGVTSQRQLGKALGIGNKRAAELFRQMESDGVVVREGKTWRLAETQPRVDEKGALTLSEARQRDLERLGKEMSGMADEIAAEFESTGTTIKATEMGDKLAQKIVDWGDIARPDDPEAGSAAIAAQLLHQLPEGLRTDETITGVMGFAKEAIPDVRAAMRDPMELAASQAGVGDAIRPGALGAAPLVDTRAAGKAATLTGLPEAVRGVWDQAKGTDHDRAEAAYAEWSRDDLDLAVKTYAEFVKGEQVEVDSILKRLARSKNRTEALDHLADRMRDLELQTEATSLLSLTPEGRGVIQRILDLRDAIFVGGAIQDHLLASLQTGESFRPSPKRGQGGHAYVPNWLGGGFQLLVSQAKRAWMWLKIVRSGMSSWFALASRNWAAGALTGAAIGAPLGGPLGAIGGAVVGSGAIPKAIRLMRSLRGKKAGNDLQRLREWTETVAADLHGELLGGKNRGATALSDAVDNLSKWRESDAAFMVERAAHGRAVAEELLARATKVFPEDSRQDAQVARWLEAKSPEDREAIGKDFTEEQRVVLHAFREFWKANRQLVANKMLPDQMIRENEYLPHLRTVRKRLEVARAALEEPLRQALAERSALPRTKKGEEKSPDRKAVEKRVQQIQRAIKKYDKDIARVAEDVVRIHGELDQIAKDWGIEDYSPHVLNQDGPMTMPDPREALASLRAHENTLLERARDWVWQSVPQRLRSGHWKRRKGMSDPTKRDASYVRSMFHYVKELYRLAPAASWYEQNRERLFGKQRVLTNEEIERGSVDRVDMATEGYRSRRVRWVDFGRGKGVRADQNMRLGGKVYTLRFDGPEGATREVHFRTYEDLLAASEMDPKSLGMGEGWTKADEQPFGHQILLLPDAGAEASPDQRIRAVETEIHETKENDADADDFDVDETTKQLHLPTFAHVKWPSEVYGRLATTEPGKFHRILAESGPESARAFADYVQGVLKDATGRHILSVAQGLTSTFASWVRHSTIGMLSPGAAVKEIADTTAMNSVRLGVDNAWEAASWAMEFSKRIHHGMEAIDKGGLAQWLTEKSLVDVGDGQIGVLPPTLVEAMKTRPEKLALMPKDKREHAMLQDEAFEQFLRSSLSGGSVMAMFTPTERRYRHGQRLTPSLTNPRQMGRLADKASWWLRGRAQEHTMQQSWLGAYMVARRGGLDKAEAYKQANLYALSCSIVANRATMAPVFHTAPGQLIRPLMTWVISQSPINYRYLFRAPGNEIVAKKAGLYGPPSLGRFARLAGRQGGRAVAKMAGMFVNMYLVQQIGQLFGFDVIRSIGQGFSEIPVVGKWAVWKSHELQAQMQLAAAPEDASRKAPEWRQKAMKMAKEHAPEWMREWAIRQAKLAGSMPADAPIFPMWGNWLPRAADTAKSWVDYFNAEFVSGDKKKAAHLWAKNVYSSFWFMRARNDLFGTEPDPSDPNFVLVRDQQTGVTNARRRKGDWARVAYNMFGSSVEDSVDRIERQVLAPIRTEREAASTRSSAWEAGTLHQRAVRARKQAEQTSDPSVRAKLLQVATDNTREFMGKVKDYARENEMTLPETRALVRRWREAAERNYILTSAERDIINAYSSDMAFRLMTAELNKVPLVDKPAMSESRWKTVQGLWFADADAMRQSLKRADKKTRTEFLRSLKTAKERWAMQKAAEEAGVGR